MVDDERKKGQRRRRMIVARERTGLGGVAVAQPPLFFCLTAT